MESLRQIWEAIAPSLGVGGAIGLFITVFVIPYLKGKVTKVSTGFESALAKYEKKVEETSAKAADEAVAKIKNIAFKQTIQPLVKSELEKVTEHANEYLTETIAELQECNNRLLDVIAALGAYFDDSLVPEAKKQAFAAAIEAAKPKVREVELYWEPSKEVEETPAKAPSPRTKKREAVK